MGLTSSIGSSSLTAGAVTLRSGVGWSGREVGLRRPACATGEVENGIGSVGGGPEAKGGGAAAATPVPGRECEWPIEPGEEASPNPAQCLKGTPRGIPEGYAEYARARSRVPTETGGAQMLDIATTRLAVAEPSSAGHKQTADGGVAGSLNDQHGHEGQTGVSDPLRGASRSSRAEGGGADAALANASDASA